jgi:molybdopterin-synthase adenylyltransferase
VVLEYAARTGIPSVHAGLSADGTVGLVRWRERFVPDAEDEPGQATCEAGEHLPFIGLVAGRLASVIAGFVRDGSRTEALLTPTTG